MNDDERDRSHALTFRRIRYLVDHCAGIHREIGETLRARSVEAPSEKERILLQSLGETELDLAEQLIEACQRAREDEEHDHRETETWIQSAPSSPVQDAEERCARLRSLPVTELDHEARTASRSLTHFFEELQATAPNESQQELTEGLARIEAKFDRRHSTTVDASLV